MSKTTIKDTRIKVRPSKTLLKLLDEHKKHIDEIPENVANVLKRNCYEISSKVQVLTNKNAIKVPRIDMDLLNKLVNNNEKIEEDSSTESIGCDNNTECSDGESFFYLDDLRWFNNFLIKLRKEESIDIYLHNLIETCSLELPENEIIKRNPELEARCQKLREQQQNLEYYKMTKNVDAALKYYPEDTVAFQMKAINGQIIAVFQFVVSVIAGFAFGFLGVEWIVGNLDFGFRLLLGVMCALIIALAEIYFLAKKLVEYDTAVDAPKQSGSPMKNPKMHSD